MERESGDWLAVLGLGQGASLEQVKEAYRDLTKVWHPDRFGSDARLQRKAEEKVKEINRAYENLGSSNAARIGNRSKLDALARAKGKARTPDRQAPRPAPAPGPKNRLVRVSLPHVEVRVDDRSGILVDLSMTGGLLLLDVAQPRGTYVSIRLEARQQSLDLQAQVVRVSPATLPGTPDSTPPQWTVGVTFVQLSSQARQAIPRFCSLLAEAGGETPT
jgi:hypothetical protein